MKYRYWKQRFMLLLLLLPLIIATAPAAYAQWSAMGSGIDDGYVEKVAVSGSNVYVVGAFTEISNNIGGYTSTDFSRVAKWNGTSWEPLGKGITNTGAQVFAVAVNGSDIYVAGSFIQVTQSDGTDLPVQNIVKWNGAASQWETVGSGLDNTVLALVEKGGKLYAGGQFTNGGTLYRVAEWNGTAWSQVGAGLDGDVYCFSVRGNDLYVGGQFTSTQGGSPNSLDHIAKWDGTNWTQVGPGINTGTIYEIATSNTQVYVAGSFNESSVKGVAKLNAAGTGWVEIGGWQPTGIESVRALVVIGEDLYVGGSFSNAGGVSAADNIATYRPSTDTWSALGTGLNGICESIQTTLYGDELYVGGSFTLASGVSSTERVAKWTVAGTYTFTGANLTLTIQNPTTTPPALTVSIVKTNSAPTGGNLPSGVNVISPYYWTVTPNVAVTFINGRVSVPLSVLGGFSVYTNLRWLKREGAGQDWTDMGGIQQYGNLVTEVPITSLSQFAIGSTSIDDPLPVELSSFSGVSTSKGIALNWRTQSETDNAGFILLRDGQEVAGYNYAPELEGQGSKATPTNYSYLDESVELGKTYKYKLRTQDLTGVQHEYSATVTVKVTEVIQPKAYNYVLKQNYPNPFNPQTIIPFDMKMAGKVELLVYDVLGRQVWSKQIDAKVGENKYTFNAGSLPTGLYFYRLKTTGFDKTMKMLLVK